MKKKLIQIFGIISSLTFQLQANEMKVSAITDGLKCKFNILDRSDDVSLRNSLIELNITNRAGEVISSSGKMDYNQVNEIKFNITDAALINLGRTFKVKITLSNKTTIFTEDKELSNLYTNRREMDFDSGVSCLELYTDQLRSSTISEIGESKLYLYSAAGDGGTRMGRYVFTTPTRLKSESTYIGSTQMFANGGPSEASKSDLDFISNHILSMNLKELGKDLTYLKKLIFLKKSFLKMPHLELPHFLKIQKQYNIKTQ
jgi:hypothetical protein